MSESGNADVASLDLDGLTSQAVLLNTIDAVCSADRGSQCSCKTFWYRVDEVRSQRSQRSFVSVARGGCSPIEMGCRGRESRRCSK